jgi:HlyD family secretion protein
VNQNVVTYPVIVATANPELKLLPGMTANLTFQVTELKDVLKIPNEALRFNPEKDQVREADQKYLELAVEAENADAATTSLTPPVDESVAASKAAARRIVWVRETTSEAAAAAAAAAAATGASGTVEASGGSAAAGASPGAAGSGVVVELWSGRLRAVEVYVGDSDYRFTHVVRGDLSAGDEVVTGIKPAGAP